MLEGSYTQKEKGKHRSGSRGRTGGGGSGGGSGSSTSGSGAGNTPIFAHHHHQRQEQANNSPLIKEIFQWEEEREQFEDEEPTPTSTPSVTHERNAGKCTENTCKMGECHQYGDGIRICKCMRGYVGHRCSELMVNIADYVEAHPETKRKIKTIAENGGGGDNLATSLNRRLLKWSQRTMQRAEHARQRAKEKEERQSHKIVHSAFQIAFGVQEDSSSDDSNSVVSSPRTNNRDPKRRKGRKGRKKRDVETTTEEPSSSAAITSHLLLCIEDCQTVLSYSSQLCPHNKLAVELRIEESHWHHIPVNRVKCCKANFSDTCQEKSQPVLTV